MIYPIIDDILDSGRVQGKDGKGIPLRGNIDREEGLFLYHLVQNNSSIQRTLEVGCGFGLSSLFICSALEQKVKPEHTIIDPNQQDAYQDIGRLNLERAGVKFFTLVEETSELALPQILKEAPASFDLIFIDGYHSFDQVALDFYYANRLLKIGGYLVFDDCSFFSISKVLAFVLKYPAYKFHSQVKETSQKKKFLRFWARLIPDFVKTHLLPLKVNNALNRLQFTSMVALKKVAADNRSNRWFTDF
jgi:predicted O-methyltransferase YrrM